MKKSLFIVSLLLVVLLAGVVVGTWVWLRGGRPQRSGEAALPGLTAAVDVRFDRWGVPYISGESTEDVVAALGWIHANDRFTQMELGRRAVFGRLSEILGEATVETDVYFRTLRFDELARHLWEVASPESRVWLESYARGVNAWLDGHELGPELRLLGADPEPWAGVHSLAFALLMARDLSFWDGRPEEARFAWLRHFGADGVRDLLGDPGLHVNEEILALANGGEAARPPAMDAERSAVAPGRPAPGSNNWAIAPQRTAARRAIVANDPHLGLHLPSVWYQAHLRSPDYEAAGMSLPGTPGIVIGRGPHVAWALTNVMLDDHDLFFEELDEAGRRVRRGDGWTDVEEKEAVIRIRGGGERRITLRSTDRGPLLDADEERGLPARSLVWTAQFPGDPVAALGALARASSRQEAFDAIEPFVCPAQNLVMAFDDGTIAYRVLGAVPQRHQGDGRLPSPGWDPDYRWDGLRPRDTHPTLVNPEEGVIVTANQDIRPPGYDLPLAAEFFPGHRAARIREKLLARENWTFDRVDEMQDDVVSLYARAVVEALSGDAVDGDARDALETLAGWDKSVDTRGPAALFALVDRELQRRAFADEARQAGLPSLGNRDRLLRLLQGSMDERWFDDVGTPVVEDRSAIVEAALAAAWRETRERWGDETSDWSYGQLHQLTLRHRLDALPLLGGWMRRGPFDLPGSESTIAAFGAVWRRGEDGREHLAVTYGSSMRWIVDWSQPEMALAALPGGQSGHPADPHYDDQVRRFLEGKLHPAPWAEGPIEAAAVSRLRLRP